MVSYVTLLVSSMLAGLLGGVVFVLSSTVFGQVMSLILLLISAVFLVGSGSVYHLGEIHRHLANAAKGEQA